MRAALALAALAFALPDGARAQAPGVVNFVVAGNPDPNGQIPAFNLVPGAGVQNFTVAYPRAKLLQGHVYVYAVGLSDVSFTGTCVASFTLTQKANGKTVTLLSQKLQSFACSPGGTWIWAAPGKAVPAVTGVATLTGVVSFGGTKAHLATSVLLQ